MFLDVIYQNDGRDLEVNRGGVCACVCVCVCVVGVRVEVKRGKTGGERAGSQPCYQTPCLASEVLQGMPQPLPC